jgi:hypothetical protein
MSDVQFNDEDRTAQVYRHLESTNSEVSGIPKLMISWGLADSPEKANFMLLMVTVFVFLIAVFIVFQTRPKTTRNVLTPAQIDYIRTTPGVNRPQNTNY